MASQAVKALVKRNVALVLGFQGTRYHGLQMAPQPGIPTIEAAVHGALHAAGAISDCNNGDRNKVKSQMQSGDILKARERIDVVFIIACNSDTCTWPM